ncbi:hypothetical protein J2Z49_002791 [Desulfofundulus luciae]|uniref:Uncharacterized protein n=1 Tax=Desulfofundulus luciae TaxID=74702 RepID=A0ABU0B6X0_9FIRM|nr:hypothetical protein [Desulfofundulus luciae]MDQ0287661.1 hypothetical protein [Desulfofundulus luciae]
MTEKKKKQPFAKGNAFIPEATGSATMVNLDGQWEHDFVDDPTPPGSSEEKSPERAGDTSGKKRP